LHAANNTDSILERAGILLNAVTNLTQSHDFETARIELDRVRELVVVLNPASLSPLDQHELFGVTVGVDIEEAEISSAEGQAERAIEKLAKIIDKYELEQKKSHFLEVYDDVKMRLAFLLTDTASFDKARLILESLKSRQQKNPIFLFYLGHCFLMTKEFSSAQKNLERALSLDPTPSIEFRAHCSLGMLFYELGDYARAKLELEAGATKATPKFLKEAHIWKWLEYTCIGLGQKAEAERYGQLVRPS
jgi:tetratricopeptide (TPR) repeat protein